MSLMKPNFRGVQKNECRIEEAIQ